MYVWQTAKTLLKATGDVILYRLFQQTDAAEKKVMEGPKWK